MKKLQIFSLGLVMFSIIHNEVLLASELPDGKTLVEQVNALNEGEHVIRNLHMKMIDRRGKERERDTISFRKFFGEDKKTILFYKSPSNVKDTAFLTFDYKDESVDDDQWLYLPALRKVRRISASDRGDYFLGTDFTYEDIKKEGKVAIEDYTYKTVGREILNDIDTYKVEATTVDDETSKELGHSKFLMWIDSEIKIVRKSIFFDLNGNKLKTVKTGDIRKVDDIWTRHKLNVQNHKTGHQTIFTFSEVDYISSVDDRLLNKQSLMRGQ